MLKLRRSLSTARRGLDTSSFSITAACSSLCVLLLLLLWGYLLVSRLGYCQCSRGNPFAFVFTCIPLCFTEPAPQNSKRASAACEREKKRESAATVCSLFTLPFLVLATEASFQSASRFVIPFIASSHLTPQPVLSLPPLPCHDSVTLHLHAVNCCNLNWTRRPLVYVLCIHIHTRTYMHISPSHSHNWAAGVVFAELSLDSCTVSCFLLHTFK